jgi:Zn-dependent protease
MDPGQILQIVLIVYSIILHEVAHGWVALRCGDETALRAGRITLNPISHVDPVGTILFPLIQIFTVGHVMLGWAKPVPVNPYFYRHRTAGDILVSIAGVVVNFSIAIALAIVIGIERLVPDGTTLKHALAITILANVALGVFNLVPIPPLDGSHVMKYLLPPRLRAGYEQIGFYGTFILLFLLATRVLHPIINPIIGEILFRLPNSIEIWRALHGY